MDTRIKRILVLDDDPSVVFGLSAYLEDDGYDVVAAGCGEEALGLIDDQAPDFAIIDMRLPDMHGNDVILAAHGRHPAIRFLVLTGSAEYVMPDEVRRCGITSEDIIYKPLTDMSKVTRKIRNAQATE